MKKYNQQEFERDIQRHIEWLWPLPPHIPETDLKGPRPSGFELKSAGLVLFFDGELDARDLEYFRICYNNTLLNPNPYMRPATVTRTDGEHIGVFFPWGKKPSRRNR